MYDTSREMGFAYMAGSSLPVTWRIPSVEFPLGAHVREALCICYGGVDSYDFHGLETMQCMVERRKGGETGVKWLQAYRGDKFWDALRDSVWPRELMNAALCRSHTLTRRGPGSTISSRRWTTWQRLVEDPVAYRYEHTDGLKCTMMLMNGLVRDFNFAATLEGAPSRSSTQMYLPMPDGRTTLANFFSPLTYNMEQMFLTGKPTYPDRADAADHGLTAAGVESLYRGQAESRLRIWRSVSAGEGSTFWRT